MRVLYVCMFSLVFLSENRTFFVMPYFMTCVSFSVRNAGRYFWNSSFCSSEPELWGLQVIGSFSSLEWLNLAPF